MNTVHYSTQKKKLRMMILFWNWKKKNLDSTVFKDHTTSVDQWNSHLKKNVDVQRKISVQVSVNQCPQKKSTGCPISINKLFKSRRHKCFIWINSQCSVQWRTSKKNSQKRRIRREYSKDKKVLLEISKRRGSFKNRKKLLKQPGGFLGTLLGITKLTYFKENKFWYII